MNTKQIVAVLAVLAMVGAGVVGAAYAYTSTTTNTANNSPETFLALSQETMTGKYMNEIVWNSEQTGNGASAAATFSATIDRAVAAGSKISAKDYICDADGKYANDSTGNVTGKDLVLIGYTQLDITGNTKDDGFLPTSVKFSVTPSNFTTVPVTGKTFTYYVIVKSSVATAMTQGSTAATAGKLSDNTTVAQINSKEITTMDTAAEFTITYPASSESAKLEVAFYILDIRPATDSDVTAGKAQTALTGLTRADLLKLDISKADDESTAAVDESARIQFKAENVTAPYN